MFFASLYRVLFFFTPNDLKGNAMRLVSPDQGAFTLRLPTNTLSSKHAWVKVMIAGLLRRIPANDRREVATEACILLRTEELALESGACVARVSVSPEDRVIHLEEAIEPAGA